MGAPTVPAGISSGRVERSRSMRLCAKARICVRRPASVLVLSATMMPPTRLSEAMPRMARATITSISETPRSRRRPVFLVFAAKLPPEPAEETGLAVGSALAAGDGALQGLRAAHVGGADGAQV